MLQLMPQLDKEYSKCLMYLVNSEWIRFGIYPKYRNFLMWIPEC